MTAFLKAKLMKLNDQTNNNIDKYRVAGKIYRIVYYIKIDLIMNHHFKIHDDSM